MSKKILYFLADNGIALKNTVPVYAPELAFSEHSAYPVTIVAKRKNNTRYKKMVSQHYYKNVHIIILCADLPCPEDSHEE